MLTALEDEINERTGKTGPEKSSTPEPRITKGRSAGLDLTEKVAEGLFQLSQPIAPFHILPEDGGDATQPPGAVRGPPCRRDGPASSLRCTCRCDFESLTGDR